MRPRVRTYSNYIITTEQYDRIVNKLKEIYNHQPICTIHHVFQQQGYNVRSTRSILNMISHE